MTKTKKKFKVGIVGCGAIGSRIAKSLRNELKSCYELTGLFDINETKSEQLEQNLSLKKVVKKSFKDLIKSSDLIVEAVNAKNTSQMIREALKAKKHVLMMSVGQLLNAQELFQLAEKNQCFLFLPSGSLGSVVKPLITPAVINVAPMTA